MPDARASSQAADIAAALFNLIAAIDRLNITILTNGRHPPPPTAPTQPEPTAAADNGGLIWIDREAPEWPARVEEYGRTHQGRKPTPYQFEPGSMRFGFWFRPSANPNH